MNRRCRYRLRRIEGEAARRQNLQRISLRTKQRAHSSLSVDWSPLILRPDWLGWNILVCCWALLTRGASRQLGYRRWWLLLLPSKGVGDIVARCVRIIWDLLLDVLLDRLVLLDPRHHRLVFGQEHVQGNTSGFPLLLCGREIIHIITEINIYMITR